MYLTMETQRNREISMVMQLVHVMSEKDTRFPNSHPSIFFSLLLMYNLHTVQFIIFSAGLEKYCQMLAIG